jgi:hypothetical protein
MAAIAKSGRRVSTCVGHTVVNSKPAAACSAGGCERDDQVALDAGT